MRVVRLFKENVLRLVFFLLFLLVFSWPYLSFLNQATPEMVFGYFFIAWLILIIVLWISNISRERNDEKKQ